MASRKISDLHPDLQPLCETFLDRAADQGIEVLITYTYRSYAEQQQLYDQGRTKPGKIVTNAKPGESEHNHELNARPASRAFDVVPLVSGKPMWDAKHPAWEQLGVIGENLGLEWAGRWKRFREYPHFQWKEATNE
ncbi:MAG: M15 family metallopeptidase [Burkholderiales bacterium]